MKRLDGGKGGQGKRDVRPREVHRDREKVVTSMLSWSEKERDTEWVKEKERCWERERERERERRREGERGEDGYIFRRKNNWKTG